MQLTHSIQTQAQSRTKNNFSNQKYPLESNKLEKR